MVRDPTMYSIQAGKQLLFIFESDLPRAGRDKIKSNDVSFIYNHRDIQQD
jgi:hypothetical protein